MSKLNVRDSNTGKFLEVDLDNPQGSYYTVDAESGKLKLINLTTKSGSFYATDANTGKSKLIDSANLSGSIYTRDDNTGKLVNINLASPSGSIYVIDENTGKLVLVDLSKLLVFNSNSGGLSVVGGGGAAAPTLKLLSNTNGDVWLWWGFSAGGGPMTIDWGDGTAPTSDMAYLSHTYTSAALKTITFSCPDWSKVIKLDLHGYGTEFRYAQPFPDLSFMPNLAILKTDQCNFPDIPATLANNSKLTSFSYRFGFVEHISAAAFTTQKDLSTFICGFNSVISSDPVDNLLAGMVTSLGVSGRVACALTMDALYFDGITKALPSESGATSAATLIAAGWTVPQVAHPWLSMIGDSISSYNPPWLMSVSAAWDGGSGVGKNAVRDWAVQSQGIVYGNPNSNYSYQVSLVSNSKMIFVLMGVNDDNSGNMTTLRSTFEAGIANLKTQNPGATIYTIGVLPCWEDNTAGAVLDKSNIRAAIAAGCASQSITYWDTYTSPVILQSDTLDGKHLTTGGQTKLANFVKAQLGI